jgi:mRNA-degrading endonuclease RelE of RelBE toxin-antitoxin system
LPAWCRAPEGSLRGFRVRIKKYPLFITLFGYIITSWNMEYQVCIKKKVNRDLTKLPKDIQKLLFLLIADLKADGPIQKSWHNFSPLGENKYHCHLTYRYVACWTWEKGKIEIEVYYVGSRKKAPY